MQNLDYEKKWLVKSDNKIMGPFSIEMLEDLLFKRQVALIDEVRDMNHRWLYIREIEELKDLADKVRIEFDKKSEQTRTLQSLSTQAGSKKEIHTNTHTKTEDIQSPQFTDSKPVFTDVSVQPKDIAFEDIDFPQLEVEKKKSAAQFVSHLDPNVKAEIKKTKSKFGLIALTVFVVIVSGFAAVYTYRKFNQAKADNQLMTRIRKLIIYGAEQKAADEFQKLPETLQRRLFPDAIVLFLRLDAEGAINLDESLQSIHEKKINNQQNAQAELVLFNKKLALNSIQEAKGHLIAAKDVNSESDIVKENEAILNYLENNNEASQSLFLNLFNTSNKGRYLFGLALNHLKKPTTFSDNEITEKIERYLSTRIEFKKELHLIQIYLSLKNSNLSAAKLFTTEFLNTPVQLSRQFMISGLIYSSIYKFEKIIPYFDKVKNQLDSKLLGLVDLHLMLEKSDGYAAQKQFDKIQGLLIASEKQNAQIAIDDILNNYQEALAIEKAAKPEDLNMPSHLSLLKMKKKNKNANVAHHVESLKKERNLISLWTDLMLINESDSSAIKSFLQQNSIGAEDFVPVIEAKVQVD
jgi:tetratricopeptide (TPR) repeat protein